MNSNYCCPNCNASLSDKELRTALKKPVRKERVKVAHDFKLELLARKLGNASVFYFKTHRK